jgi:PUB domain
MEEGEEEDSKKVIHPLSSPLQEKMVEQIESISDTLKSFVNVQEKILQKVSTNASITNSSMDLLRSSSTSTSVKNDKREDGEILLIHIWSQLVEIKADLKNFLLYSGKKGSNVVDTDEISKSLLKLDKCLEKLSSSSVVGVNGYKRMPTLPTTQVEPTEKESTNSIHSAAAPTANSSVGNNTTVTQNFKDESMVKNVNDVVATNNPSNSLGTQEENRNTTANSTTMNVVVDESSTVNNSAPTPTLRQAVEIMVGENDPTSLRVGSQILFLYFVNLSEKPNNARYRKMYTSSESFQKIEKLKGAKCMLLAVGFQERTGYLEWLPEGTAEQESFFLPKLKEGVSVLSVLKSGNPNLKDAALAAIGANI